MEGKNEDDDEELQRLLRQRGADQEVIDRERESSPLRSGSPPLTEDQLFAFLSDGDVYEKQRSDPGYVNLNPRLPLPLPEKRDLRSTRSEIGDRRNMNDGGGESVFSMQPVSDQAKEDMHKTQNNEPKRDDLIGLPGLALRDRPKGIADAVQDEIASATPVSRNPIRPSSSAYEDTEYSGSHAAPHNVLPSLNTLNSNTNVHDNSSLQSIGSSVPQTRCCELGEIAGRVVEFSVNQSGNRFIQQKLETASTEEKNMVFREIMPQALSLMTDVYGNYVIRKFLEYGNASQIRQLAEQLTGNFLTISFNKYGSLVIQKFYEYGDASHIRQLVEQLTGNFLTLSFSKYGSLLIQKFFEYGDDSHIRLLAEQSRGNFLTLSLNKYGSLVIQKNQEVIMVEELDGHIMRCARDPCANYVIQKCIECVPRAASHFIHTAFRHQVVALSTDPYGCLVIQRVLDHCRDPTTRSIVFNEILQSVCILSEDQYGNYVIQHLLEKGEPHERSSIMNQLIGKTVQMSQQKFSYNVILKCLSFVTPEKRQSVVHEILGSSDENEPLQEMLENKFALYVLQKVLETCDDQQLRLILDRVKVHLKALRKRSSGIHSVNRIEKLVAAGEKRIRHRK